MVHALHMTAWHPIIDGVSGTFVLEQCAALRASGVQAGLIFSRIQGLGDLSLRRVARGIPAMVSDARPVPTIGFKSWNLPGMRRYVAAFNANMLQNRFRAYTRIYGWPDVLHAHVAIEAGVAARKIAKATGLKYIVTEHSSEILNGCHSENRRALAKAVYEDAQHVVAVSQSLAESISKICPTANITVINNLVRDDVFQLKYDQPRASGTLKIVTMGSLVPLKRVDKAIATLGEVAKRDGVALEHHIIGDGPERNRLEAMSSQSIVRTYFHGFLNHPKAMAILSDADFLLHCSAYETFGIVLAEAMALGLPVVATRCGGPQEIVTNDTGRLVDIDDAEEMVRAVCQLISEIGYWRSRRGGISAYAFSRFHEKSISKDIMRLYRS